jgi:hypothetical protein
VVGLNIERDSALEDATPELAYHRSIILPRDFLGTPNANDASPENVMLTLIAKSTTSEEPNTNRLYTPEERGKLVHKRRKAWLRCIPLLMQRKMNSRRDDVWKWL